MEIALPGGYSVTQIRHAYGFDKLNATGAGQTIAIVDAYGSTTLQNDLNNFCAAMGIPSTTLGVYIRRASRGSRTAAGRWRRRSMWNGRTPSRRAQKSWS